VVREHYAAAEAIALQGSNASRNVIVRCAANSIAVAYRTRNAAVINRQTASWPGRTAIDSCDSGLS